MSLQFFGLGFRFAELLTKTPTMKAFLHILVLIFLFMSANAQTLINKLWQDTTGHPSITYYMQCAKIDASGNVYVAGSTYHSGQSDNLLITKYSSTGNRLWQKEFDSPGSYADILTDFYIKGGNYYCTGTYWDSVHAKSWAGTLKGNTSTGDTVWTRIYSGSFGGYDAGGTIKVDQNQNVYIGGTDQQSSTNFRMLVMKYDSAGTQQWISYYDSSGYYDAGVDMTITGGSTAAKNVAIVGFSGSGFANWDFVTANFNPATGVASKVVRTANANGAFSQPAGIVKDYSDNIIICGTASVGGSNTDVKIIKYDTLLNQLWLKTWGNSDSLHDEATAIVMDNYANYLITGYTTNSNGSKSLLVLKYNASGTLQWSQIVGAPTYNKDCVGKDITVDDSLNVYVAGYVNNGSDNDYITLCYDKNGHLKWKKTFSGGGTANDQAFDIVVDTLHKVYVSGSSAAASTKFITLCYGQLDIDKSFATGAGGNPISIKGQALIRLDTSAVLRSEINNFDRTFWAPKELLQTWAIDSLKKKYADFEKCYLGRVFSYLRTTDTVSISRLGDKVRVPDFWSTFVLVFNKPVNERKVCDTINQLFPLVEFSELDLVMKEYSAPNDIQYYLQKSFFPSVDYPNGGVNVEQAWNYTTGKPFVKVGIFDTGVKGDHEDFLADGTNISSSVVKGGYDCILGNLLTVGGNNDPQGHGTSCAGIIGACRNNSWGVAGIAGGDTLGKPGVSMYGFRLFEDQGANIFATVRRTADAFLQSSLNIPDSTYGYRLHMVNNSYGFGTAAGLFYLDSNVTLMKKVWHTANRNKLLMVFASGNDDVDYLPYPKNIDDDWMVVVGGTGGNGNYKDFADPDDPGWSPNYGSGIDLSAPCVPYMINTTVLGGFGGSFGPFDGTSAACPHVVGTAALLCSYLNDSLSKYKNLAPEDYEYVLQRSAYNIDLPGYDTITGWGRLNAGGALSVVDTSKRKLIHFDSDSLTKTQTFVQTDTNVIIWLVEEGVSVTGQPFKRDSYHADVYRLTTTTTQPLTSTDTVVAYWPRSSSSESYGYYNANHELVPHEKCSMSSVSYLHSTLQGYFYHLKDSVTNAHKGWIPFDTAYAHNANFAYSFLVGRAIYAPWDTLISDVVTIKQSQYSARIFPNPSSQTQILQLHGESEDCHIIVKMFDAAGILVKEIYNGNLGVGEMQFTIDLAPLNAGMYIYVFQDAMGNTKYIKSMKF